MDDLTVIDNMFYNYCLCVYSTLSGYSRAYRDMCRKEGLNDEAIKKRINQITSDAIKFNQQITALIESEEQEAENGEQMGE